MKMRKRLILLRFLYRAKCSLHLALRKEMPDAKSSLVMQAGTNLQICVLVNLHAPVLHVSLLVLLLRVG